MNDQGAITGGLVTGNATQPAVETVYQRSLHEATVNGMFLRFVVSPTSARREVTVSLGVPETMILNYLIGIVNFDWAERDTFIHTVFGQAPRLPPGRPETAKPNLTAI